MAATGDRSDDDVERYVDSIADALREREFRPFEGNLPDHVSSVFHRGKFEPRKFGFVDAFVVVTRPESPTPADLEASCTSAFDFGLDNKSRFPRGLGGSLVVYPVVVGDGISRAARDWIAAYRPRHWASFEIPVLFDLSANEAVYDGSTPVWGRWYYAGFHETIEAVLVPNGWDVTRRY